MRAKSVPIRAVREIKFSGRERRISLAFLFVKHIRDYENDQANGRERKCKRNAKFRRKF